MDPVSITIGAISVVDVCSRFVVYLRNVKKATASIDQDLKALADDVEALRKTAAVLKESYEARLVHTREDSDSEQDKLSRTWQNVTQLLPKCEGIIEKLQTLVEDVRSGGWSKTPQKIEAFVKYLRRLRREEEFLSLRRDLSNYGSTLQMLLSAIQV